MAMDTNKMYSFMVLRESDKTSQWTTYRGTGSLGDVSMYHKGRLAITEPQGPAEQGVHDVYCTKIYSDPDSSPAPKYDCLFQTDDKVHEFTTDTDPSAGPGAMWKERTSQVSVDASSWKLTTPAAHELLGTNTSLGLRYDCRSASNECWEPNNEKQCATCDETVCDGRKSTCVKEDDESQYTVFCGEPQARMMTSSVDAPTGTLLHTDDHIYMFLIDKPTV